MTSATQEIAITAILLWKVYFLNRKQPDLPNEHQPDLVNQHHSDLLNHHQGK